MMHGDCRELLPTLPDASVHCVVTSPPYFGLRDYGTAQWDGGDAECDHSGRKNHGHSADVGERNADGNAFRNSGRYVNQGNATGMQCSCGAVRVDRQIGLEASPDEFIAQMVAVFREVKRVLRPDGTLWLNMGDSYAGGGGFSVGAPSNATSKSGMYGAQGALKAGGIKSGNGIKPKDLLMMPARVALALQADGWWLRSDIIWAKPNPMPESVTDRPTSSHEHVFLLTRSPRYFYDADSIAEPALQSVGDLATASGRHSQRKQAEIGQNQSLTSSLGANHGNATRSCRNVWTIATEAFPESHFATFPTALVEKCVRAGTSERGCCAACGKQWVRQARSGLGLGAYNDHSQDAVAGMSAPSPAKLNGQQLAAARAAMADDPVVWTASCQCNAGAPVPATVLDPFAGAGTTCLVADRLQRNAIGIELSESYVTMGTNRITNDAPLFSSWPPAEDPADQRMATEARQRDLFGWAAD